MRWSSGGFLFMRQILRVASFSVNPPHPNLIWESLAAAFACSWSPFFLVSAQNLCKLPQNEASDEVMRCQSPISKSCTTLPYIRQIPRCSRWVLWVWQSWQRDWNTLRTNASTPICDQGNRWSTCFASVTMPLVRQDWQSGWVVSCRIRCCFQAFVSYMALKARRSTVLLRLLSHTSLPPCCRQ